MKKLIIIIFFISATVFIRSHLAMQGETLRSQRRTSVFTSQINQLLPEPQAGLLNGILFGEKAQMDGKFFDQLRRTGTLHVIALSGMNITILVNLLGQVTLFLGRGKSMIINIIMIIIFIWFVGPSASVVRAGIMGAITLIGVFFGRQSWGVLSLLIAGGIMLLLKPLWLYDLGFQLSFLATAGIMTIGGLRGLGGEGELREEKPHHSPYSLHTLHSLISKDFQTTLAAQVFTLPILLYNFGQISLVAPLTNVLVLWIVEPIMLLGFILAIMSNMPYMSDMLAMPLAWVLWVPLTYFIKVIEITAGIPFANLSF